MRQDNRPPTFYVLAFLLTVFLVFLYGPTIVIAVLSFQGPDGGLTFPMRGISLHWFHQVFAGSAIGNIGGAFRRSFVLALLVMAITTAFSFLAGLAFRRRFAGSGFVFYLAIASLIIPSIVISLGIGSMFELLGVSRSWLTSALGAQLTWTLPFGLLVMFAAFNRFDSSFEEAAKGLGAGDLRSIWEIVVPILAPGLLAVALFGFTLSYDELPRTSQTAGALNTLPLELQAMQSNSTTPVIYALGTLTTLVSIAVIGLFIGLVFLFRRRAKKRAETVNPAS